MRLSCCILFTVRFSSFPSLHGWSPPENSVWIFVCKILITVPGIGRPPSLLASFISWFFFIKAEKKAALGTDSTFVVTWGHAGAADGGPLGCGMTSQGKGASAREESRSRVAAGAQPGPDGLRVGAWC